MRFGMAHKPCLFWLFYFGLMGSSKSIFPSIYDCTTGGGKMHSVSSGKGTMIFLFPCLYGRQAL